MIGDSVTVGPLGISAPWISVRGAPDGGQRIQISHGVWLLVHSRRWLPISTLDSARYGGEASAPDRPEGVGLAWHAGAACAGSDNADERFFGRKSQQAFPPTELARTKALCHSCPVERDCLTWALTSTHRLADGYVVTGERYGVWGSTTRRQRLALLERIEAGTPVSDIVAEVLDGHQATRQRKRQQARASALCRAGSFRPRLRALEAAAARRAVERGGQPDRLRECGTGPDGTSSLHASGPA